MTPGADQNHLSWRINGFQRETPGVRHALLASRDGLKLSWNDELGVDDADHLAAVASGLLGLTEEGFRHFGATGGVQHIMADSLDLQLLVVGAGGGSTLIVVAHGEADPGMVGHAMRQLVDQLADHLATPARTGEGHSG